MRNVTNGRLIVYWNDDKVIYDSKDGTRDPKTWNPGMWRTASATSGMNRIRVVFTRQDPRKKSSAWFGMVSD